MTVSMGFFRKIEQWLIDEQSGEILFLPFQADGNAYKSKVLLVGSQPEPLIQIGNADIQFLADALVDRHLFQDVFQEEISEASREYRGALNFASWMKENLKQQVVFSSLNCLNVEDELLKQLKKSKDPLYLRGFEIFKEVIDELEPELLIIQGAPTFKQFIERFKEHLADYAEEDLLQSVQVLEQKGSIGQLKLNNGKKAQILVCRSMGAFGKTGKSFGEFKSILEGIFQ
ncbi:hypothetical protein D1B33_16420 [Lysinibacillus yapensis]|uniref:Uracil-DNA glycosylase-like domain-containing protein n=1 Tax=Ureibacillus yapensis TaxID=2304605 RepID=A0A396SIJ9_9BACL|nr:hypothetical protein [Lysinibacillus yapensis]RHW32751.1 hypothetical protein D1B33_16420 [Lysinibacillus yapensis]